MSSGVLPARVQGVGAAATGVGDNRAAQVAPNDGNHRSLVVLELVDPDVVDRRFDTIVAATGGE